LGSTAWALDTLINYALVIPACRSGFNPVPIVALVLTMASLAGALSSWLAWRRDDGARVPMPEQDGHPRHLLSGIGMASGVLFAVVIAMQGVGALLLEPCLR
jgi:hypothetical protein